MTKRRVVSAAPFVLVIACKGPQPPHEREPDDDQEEPAEDAAVSSEPAPMPVAVAETPVDAMEAEIDAAPPIDAAPAPRRLPENPDKRPCCANPPQPTVRVVRTSVQGDEVVITVPIGTADGVDAKNFRGTVLRGDSGTAMPGGDVTWIRCDQRSCVGKVKLTTDQISANPRVRMTIR